MKYFFIVFTILLISCDGGLKPIPPTILKGKIYYSPKDEWPPEDSLKDLRLVALKNFPPENIITEIISGNAYYTETLPYFVDSTIFEIEIKDAPVNLKYIGVAQNFGELIDWRVLGVYSLKNNNEHSEIFIEKNSINDIIINVDFNNIPEQPFDVQ